jgi:hypothetical protein
VPGDLSSEEFIERSTSDDQGDGRVFDPDRYFVEDDELLRSSGNTSAITNQWGLQTKDAINLLIQKFPHAGVSCSPTDVTT